MSNIEVKEEDRIKNISMENFGQPRLIINCDNIEQCDKRKSQILQNQKLRQLVEKDFKYYDETFTKHKDIDDFKIAQVLSNLLRKSLLDEVKK